MGIKRAFTRVACAAALVAAAGCGGGEASAPGKAAGAKAGPRLMFISNSNSDWWNAVETGMNDGGKAFGAAVEMRRVEGESAQQIMRIEDVLGLPDVDGVAISVIEAESPGVADKMRDLQKAGKIVIAIDSDGQKDARRAYIGTINRKAGERAGEVARMLRPKGGETVAFVGTAAAANARERREGFFAAAGTGFTQAEVFEDGTDKSKARINVQTAINKYTGVGVFLGLWSYNAHFIAEEVAKFPELRNRATVVTFDLDELAVADLDNGTIDATVCQNPYEIGYLAVKLLKALIVKDSKTVAEMLPGGTDVIDTGVRVVVPKKGGKVQGPDVVDVEEMKAWLAGKGLKSS